MKRKGSLIKGLFLGSSLIFSTLAVKAEAETISFISDTTWTVTDPTGAVVGLSQHVCLNPSFPSNCPAGATSWEFGSSGWVDPSSIGAAWIWAPGITAATAPAVPAEYSFSKTLTLPGTPTAGSITLAADDFGQVIVNGTVVATIGSLTDTWLGLLAENYLHTFDIAPFLVAGNNVITVRAANGYFGYPGGPYSSNPAGTVFAGTITFAANNATIDIKPKGLPNSINPRSNGVIPVGVLTTDTLDATTINPTSVRFGRTGTEAAPVHMAQEDVDGDGDMDLILHFDTRLTGIQCGDTAASLKGETFGGQAVQGSDSVRTAGCK